VVICLLVSREDEGKKIKANFTLAGPKIYIKNKAFIFLCKGDDTGFKA
jgi:hypothetical protein